MTELILVDDGRVAASVRYWSFNSYASRFSLVLPLPLEGKRGYWGEAKMARRALRDRSDGI